MNEALLIFLIFLLAFAGYAAGRVHGQYGYRAGYRGGYRQGYFDGDRASWNRSRRELQAAVSSALANPPARRPQPYPANGTTYTSRAPEDGAGEDEYAAATGQVNASASASAEDAGVVADAGVVHQLVEAG